jgi:hypothetical protein
MVVLSTLIGVAIVEGSGHPNSIRARMGTYYRSGAR